MLKAVKEMYNITRRVTIVIIFSFILCFYLYEIYCHYSSDYSLKSNKFIQPDQVNFMKEREKIYAERIQLVKKACENMKIIENNIYNDSRKVNIYFFLQKKKDFILNFKNISHKIDMQNCIKD